MPWAAGASPDATMTSGTPALPRLLGILDTAGQFRLAHGAPIWYTVRRRPSEGVN